MVRDHRIESFIFQPGSVIGDNFAASTWRSINGILLGVRTRENNYAATGSLILASKNAGEVIWSLVSGTATGNTAKSGLYLPVAYPVNLNNQTLSGTGAVVEIPLYGEYTLTGSALGAGKSGLGIELIYKMG